MMRNMDSFENPVGRPDPFDRYRVEGVGEKQSEGGQSGQPGEEPPPKKQEGLIAHLAQILQRAVSYFLEQEGNAETEVRKNLLLLRNAFEALKQGDRSQDIRFLNELARVWNQSLEDSFSYEPGRASERFKELVHRILHYPENQAHTLGYYLTEYAGQKWVPFPYMELIQKIHSEYEKNPPSSPLTEWTLLLDDVLQLLKEK